MVSSFIHRLVALAVIVYLMSACGDSPAVATETWTLVKILTQGENVESTTETVDVRNCCGVVERKTVSCSAGTSNELNVNIGAGIGVQVGGQLTINPNVGITLGLNRDNGESLELDPPSANHIYRYKVTKTYSVIAGDALLRSSNGNEQTIAYRFQAKCSLRIEPSTETLVCGGTCQEGAVPATEEKVTVTPSFTDTPIPPTNTPVPPTAKPTFTNIPIRPTKIPTPQLTPTVPSDMGMIILQGSYNLGGLGTQVQWLDGLGRWHNVENWRGQLDNTGRISWLVWPKDFDTGPFRWVVYNRDGSVRFESQSFYLPGAGQGYLIGIE